jgi:hypothetical protein
MVLIVSHLLVSLDPQLHCGEGSSAPVGPIVPPLPGSVWAEILMTTPVSATIFAVCTLVEAASDTL